MRATGEGWWARLATRVTAVATGLSTLALVLAAALVAASFLVTTDDAPATSVAASTLAPADPLRVVLPDLKVKATVVARQVDDDGVLDPPPAVAKVGWWDASAQPGSPTGQTVLTGHGGSTPGGSLDGLDTLERGGRVEVVTGAGRLRYEVSRVKVLGSERAARQAGSMFGQDRGAGRLVLISCDDDNGSFYERFVVVLAVPSGPSGRR